MKKLDKLLLKSFLGPFILTFVVVVFILLTQYMLKYFEEFVGKDLGFYVFVELIMYFSINMTPMALPLAVLLSSLMTFGNLGEHFELTAIKSAGISLTRVLLPLFIFSCMLSVLAFFSNNYIVPKANLKAYSLLYDIKKTKPSLDLKEGAFYNGIPNYSIKVDKKHTDGVTLGNLIIYDHSSGQGNTKVILADSGKMYTIHNNTYLMLELFRGNSYSELASQGSRVGKNVIEDFHRNAFDESKLVFSLASFGLQETNKELFADNRLMKNAGQLTDDIDSMRIALQKLQLEMYDNSNRYFSYHLKDKLKIPEYLIPKSIEMPDDGIENNENEQTSQNSTPSKKEYLPRLMAGSPYAFAKREGMDTVSRKEIAEGNTNMTVDSLQADSLKNTAQADSINAPIILDPVAIAWTHIDSLFHIPQRKQKVLGQALSQARYVKNNVSMQATRDKNLTKELNTYIIEKNKKYSQAVACLIMFLIGAPLGAIIKKGGLGIPVIVSIAFFIIFYVLSITGEKWGKESLLDPILATWISNIILLPFGLFFLKQARNDVRVFEADFYKVAFDKLKTRLRKIGLFKG